MSVICEEQERTNFYPSNQNVVDEIEILFLKVTLFKVKLAWISDLVNTYLGEKMESTEPVVQRSRLKKVFLKISQNSQENTCARVTLLKKRLWQRVSKHIFYWTPLGDCFCIYWVSADDDKSDNVYQSNHEILGVLGTNNAWYF